MANNKSNDSPSSSEEGNTKGKNIKEGKSMANANAGDKKADDSIMEQKPNNSESVNLSYKFDETYLCCEK